MLMLSVKPAKLLQLLPPLLLVIFLVSPAAAQPPNYSFESGSLNFNSSKITITSGHASYTHTKFVGEAGEKNMYSLELNFFLSLILSNSSQAILRIDFTRGISTRNSGGFGWGPQQRDVPYDDLIQFTYDETIKENFIQAIEFKYQQKNTTPNPLAIDLHSSFIRDFDTKIDTMGYNITLSIIHQNEVNTTSIGSYNHNNIIYYGEIVSTDEDFFLSISPLLILTSFAMMVYYKRMKNTPI